MTDDKKLKILKKKKDSAEHAEGFFRQINFPQHMGKIVYGHAKNVWVKKSLREEEENSGTKSVKVEWMIP